MPNAPTLLTSRRIRICLTLVTLLASVYMFTYTGRIESSDTRALFDVTSSLVQYGDAYLDASAWYNYPLPDASGEYPLVWSGAEPLQPLLSAPLYWLAYHLPGIGLIHAVWLFNVLVCALAGGVFFLYVLALGYSERVAVLATVVFGLLTILWPYSKTYFREPLALLTLLFAALCIERWRAGRYRSLLLLITIGCFLVAGWFTKEAIILAMLALVVIAAPAFQLSKGQHRLVRTLFRLGLGLLVVFSLVVLLGNHLDWPPFYENLSRLIGFNTSYIQNAHIVLHTYLFSVGGSVWGTSPILLLAIPGVWLLYRQDAYRYILVILLLLLSFSVGYAVLRGPHWFGGLSWPPRFLVPIIPFLVIGILPILEHLTKSLPQRGLVVIVALLSLYSLWIQLNGLLLPWGTYNQILPPEASGLGEWSGGLNQVQYLRWFLLPQRWSTDPLDFVWARISVPHWPVMFAALCALCGIALWRQRGEKSTARFQPLRIASLPVLFVFMAWFGLRSIYNDPLYLGDRQPLHDLLPTIASMGEPGDVLLLDNTHYSPFLMNYGKFDYPRVITLSDQPGEQPSPEQPALVSSDNPDLLLLPITPPLIFNLTRTRDHIWLLSDSSVWLPWRVRPVERFLASHFYPVQEQSTQPPNPEIRLIEYHTTPAPNRFDFRGPEYLTDLRYGESIYLSGFTLPSGTAYQPGDILPITLVWTADELILQNYTVALFLVSTESGREVQAADSQPYWGFAPTTTWKPDISVWDNRALRLPSDLESGAYQLWIRVYQSDLPENVLPVTGEIVREGITGILPIHIDITPAS